MPRVTGGSIDAHRRLTRRRIFDAFAELLAEVPNPVDRLRAFVAAQLGYVATHHLPPDRTLRLALSGPAYERVLGHVSALEQVLRENFRDGVAEGYLPIAGDERWR